MDGHKIQKKSIKVTSGFLIDNPTKEDIQKLQREVQYILLTSISIQLNNMKLDEYKEKII